MPDFSFRPPSFAQPSQINVPRSIDELFNTYQQLKNQQEQGLRQDTEDTANFGAPLSQLTPERLNEAMQPQQRYTVPGALAPQNAAQPFNVNAPNNGFALNQPPQDVQGVLPDSHPIVTGVRDYIARKRAANQVAGQESQAKLDLTRSETIKNLRGAPGESYTLDQAASLASRPGENLDTAKARLGTLYPNGQVPKDFIHTMATNNRQEYSLGEKEDQFADKRLTALGEALDPSKSSRSPLGVSKTVFDRAERLQTLAGAYKNNNLDSRQIEELAIGLNAMLSGSNTGAQSTTEALVPKSIVGDVQKFKEWFTNNPKGTNQQEFVKRMLGSIEREKSTAEDQIKRTQMERVARYADLEGKSKDRFYNVLQSNGIEPDEYQKWKKGGFKRQSAVQGSEGGTKSSDPLGIL